MHSYMQTTIFVLIGLVCMIILLAFLIRNKKDKIDKIIEQTLEPTILSGKDLENIIKRFYG